jgi:vacuolar-type H+-ATPase subunit F/Vma7
VDAKTENATIAEAFDRFTQKRKDIAILLINQHVRSLLFADYIGALALTYLYIDR